MSCINSVHLQAGDLHVAVRALLGVEHVELNALLAGRMPTTHHHRVLTLTVTNVAQLVLPDLLRIYRLALVQLLQTRFQLRKNFLEVLENLHFLVTLSMHRLINDFVHLLQLVDLVYIVLYHYLNYCLDLVLF